MLSNIINNLTSALVTLSFISILVLLFVDSIPILNKLIPYSKFGIMALAIFLGYFSFKYGKSQERIEWQNKVATADQIESVKQTSSKTANDMIEASTNASKERIKTVVDKQIITIVKDSKEINTKCEIPKTTIDALNNIADGTNK